MRRDRLRTLVGFVLLSALALALAGYTLGPLTRALWAIVDDHEIAYFTGPAGRLAFADIPQMLGQTEIGYTGYVPRFRPGYFVLRLWETSLWGATPHRWYRARLGLYAVSVVLLGWVIAARIGLVATAGLLVWVLSAPYWFDVWRLGAAEAYAVLGCGLWAFGLHLLWPACAPSGRWSPWRTRGGALLFVVGNLVVVSSKENFVVIAVPNLLLAFNEMRAGRRGGIRWWACITGLVSGVLMTIPLVFYFSHASVDIYGRSVTLQARLAVLARATAHVTIVSAAFMLAVALRIALRVTTLAGLMRASPAFRTLTSRLTLVSAAALALYEAQFVLYAGDITPRSRYEFPAALATPGLLVGVSLCLREFFRRTGAPDTERLVRHATAAVFLSLAVLAAPGLHEQRGLSRTWVRGTKDFTARIRAAAAAAREDPHAPVVVMSGRPLDVEPILSVARFLQALGATNPRFLVLDWLPLRSRWTPLDAHLAAGLERQAREGGLGYEPMAGLDANAPCFSIGLSREPRPGCRNLWRLWDFASHWP